MALSSSRDNWERLVAAVVKKEQIWQLCHQDSISTIASDFTDGILSSSSNSPRPVSPSPSPELSLTNNSVVEDRKNASKTITQKLFSALLWRRKATYYDLDQGLVGISEDYLGFRSFSLHKLLVATDNFSNRNVLGHGGHSTVYKGRLADGSLMAVKRLRKRVTQKDLEIANLVTHRNVLRLRGFCISQKEQLLIYPFMENGSVASHLRERPEMQPPLGWQVRKTIALGVAKGLAYLHHESIKGIIHGDVKAANILLNENFEAVVADFTLAQFVDCDDGVVRGTIGHIAPEYLSSGKCSEKTDVFGYGAFLLELITGQRPFDLARYADDDGMKLLDWVKNLCEKRMYEVLVDSNLRWAYAEEEVKELLQMAAVCTQNNPKERPTMLEVVSMLEDGDGLAERWEGFLINDFRNENSSSKVWDKFLINDFRNENSSSKVWDKFLINDFRNENSSSKVHEIGCKSSSSKVHEIGCKSSSSKVHEIGWNIDDSSSSTGAEELSGPR